jgi:transposase InsO family protein
MEASSVVVTTTSLKKTPWHWSKVCLRIRWDLRERGERCGKNRVARLMREEGLRPRQKRPFRPRTTDSGHDHKVAVNWLAKVPAPGRPRVAERHYLH